MASTATTPFLSSRSDVTLDDSTARGYVRRQAARFLRRASGGRLRRESSMLVRQTAAVQLGERQSDWAYSKPVVILDIIWNIALVAVAAAVLVLSWDERPEQPLRVWIIVHSLQCLLHMVCVCVEYRRRRSQRSVEYSPFNAADVEKYLEYANIMFSIFFWWWMGSLWLDQGGQNLARASPQLYWLCIVYFGLDLFFVVVCVGLAGIIGLAVCCCLPCVFAFLYALAGHEGLSKGLDQLPKFKFRKIGNDEKCAGDIPESVGGLMTECGIDSPIERVLSEDDAECCICLSVYEDGVELRELLCRHHFHCACVDKWLHINATCPLCKSNIPLSSNHEEV